MAKAIIIVNWIYDAIMLKTLLLRMRFAFALLTREMICVLIACQFKIELSLASVGQLLAQLGLSVQRPLHAAHEQNLDLVNTWLRREYPRIKVRATRDGTMIFLAGEAGIRLDHHTVTTWGAAGKTPVVPTTGKRVSCNMISATSAKGKMCFMVMSGRFKAGVFIDFLKRLITGRTQKPFLIVDGHSAHHAKKTKSFVASIKDRLELIFLLPCSPEMNPDELVWNHVRNNNIGRMVIEGKEELVFAARSVLHSLSKAPDKIRAFFQRSSLCYAMPCRIKYYPTCELFNNAIESTRQEIRESKEVPVS